MNDLKDYLDAFASADAAARPPLRAATSLAPSRMVAVYSPPASVQTWPSAGACPHGWMGGPCPYCRARPGGLALPPAGTFPTVLPSSVRPLVPFTPIVRPAVLPVVPVAPTSITCADGFTTSDPVNCATHGGIATPLPPGATPPPPPGATPPPPGSGLPDTPPAAQCPANATYDAATNTCACAAGFQPNAAGTSCDPAPAAKPAGLPWGMLLLVGGAYLVLRGLRR